MLCIYCNNPNHSIEQCQVDVDMFYDPFRELVAANPYALRQQFLLLNRFSKPVIMRISNICGLNFAGTKQNAVYNIIRTYFMCLYRPGAALGPHEEVMPKIQEAIVDVESWIPSTPEIRRIQENMINILGLFCIRMFRNNNEHQTTPIQLNTQLETKSHLQQLQINVTVEATLEIKECFICYDIRPLAELGCRHNYCTDCIVNTAKTRTKSVITCAVCREEISEIKVGTEELRAEIDTRLAVE